MLREILETRVMVKQAMKLAKQRNDSALVRMLNARQLGLKMIANVTYGYVCVHVCYVCIMFDVRVCAFARCYMRCCVCSLYNSIHPLY